MSLTGLASGGTLSALLAQETAAGGPSLLERLLNPASLPFLGCFLGLVAIVGYYWHATACERSRNDLKRDMVARGMSAEEIERVLEAGGGDAGKRPARPPGRQ